jgi:TonB family protein
VFTEIQPKGSLHHYCPVALSVLGHLGLLTAILLSHPRLIDLVPSGLAYGNGAHSYRIVYVAPGDEPAGPPDAKLTFSARIAPRRHRAPTPKHQQRDLSMPAEADIATQQLRAGSPLGTMIEGPITGHEVHVAYPIVFPDPAVVRTELPAGLQGDVVVEVTIDSRGEVVETRILQAIGHGIDEKIVSALRQWRFQPATLDGTPVASKHDVHFHFPS